MCKLLLTMTLGLGAFSFLALAPTAAEAHPGRGYGGYGRGGYGRGAYEHGGHEHGGYGRGGYYERDGHDHHDFGRNWNNSYYGIGGFLPQISAYTPYYQGYSYSPWANIQSPYGYYSPYYPQQ